MAAAESLVIVANGLLGVPERFSTLVIPLFRPSKPSVLLPTVGYGQSSSRIRVMYFIVYLELRVWLDRVMVTRSRE